MTDCNCKSCTDCLERENTQNVSIAVLKTEMSDTRLFIESMNKTHLPHIYESIKKVDIQLSRLTIWDKIKSITLMAASGIIGSMTTYIFLNH